MSDLNLNRFKPVLTDQEKQPAVWDKGRAINMINSIMEKAAEADPCCGVPQWAKDNVPELYDEVMASFHALQQPFDDKDLDGVRAAARRYGVAFRAVLNAYEADRAESGTQLDLVTA